MKLFGQVKSDNVFYAENSPLNLIYLGVFNPIKFTDKKYSKMDLKYFLENGKIIVTPNDFNLIAFNVDSIKLSIYKYVDKDSTLICI
jgi:hypothetical protein